MNHEPLTTRWMRFCGNVQLVTKSLTLAVIGFAFLFGKIRDVPWGLVSFLSGLTILIAAFLRLLIDFGQMESLFLGVSPARTFRCGACREAEVRL